MSIDRKIGIGIVGAALRARRRFPDLETLKTRASFQLPAATVKTRRRSPKNSASSASQMIGRN
jgi:hypothetical protein